MNITKFTQKSVEIMNNLEKIAYDFGNQEIVQEHLIYSMLTIDDSLLAKLLQKMEIDPAVFQAQVERLLKKRPKVEGGQVYIGNESPIQTMKDCSVVTATYELGEGVKGTVGIIGPKRMDYENVMDNLKTLKIQLDTVFRKPRKT